MFFTYDEGYYSPTTAGFVLLVLILLAALFLAACLLSRKGKGSKRVGFSAKKLAFCSAAVAISFVLSYIPIIKLPYGGSVTPFSMLFICLIGTWYGLPAGLLTGFSYSILEFLQEPLILTPLQVCCDYFLAFTALGLSGLFCNRPHGLRIGYIVGVLGRFFFSVIAGYLFWFDYMPENFPNAIRFAYPLVYNGSYLFLEAALTLIVLSIPSVKKAMQQVRDMAVR